MLASSAVVGSGVAGINLSAVAICDAAGAVLDVGAISNLLRTVMLSSVPADINGINADQGTAPSSSFSGRFENGFRLKVSTFSLGCAAGSGSVGTEVAGKFLALVRYENGGSGVGVVFVGYPYTDLKTVIETAGDVNQMQGELFQAEAKSGPLLANFLLTAGHSGAESSCARDSKVVSDGISTNDDAFNAGCGIDAVNEDSNVVFSCLSSDILGFAQTGAVPFDNRFRSSIPEPYPLSLRGPNAEEILLCGVAQVKIGFPIPKRKMGMLRDLQTRSLTSRRLVHGFPCIRNA